MTEVITPTRQLGGLQVQRVQQRSQYLNMLVYGQSGVGKTRLAGSADEVPEMRPVLVVDIEGGTETLRDVYPEVDTVRVRNWKEMQVLYQELYKGTSGYQTIVLDSLTEIQKLNMYQIMADLIKTRPDLDPDVPSVREWGKNLEQIRKFVRGFRDLPMHTIFTALEVETKDERTGLVKYGPMLSGKLRAEIPAFLDLVLYYYTKKSPKDDDYVRALLAQMTDNFMAKDRTGKLPKILQAPTMVDIFKYVGVN